MLQLLDGDVEEVEQQADVACALHARRDIEQPALRREHHLTLARRAQAEAVIRADQRLILGDRDQEALLLALGGAEGARQVLVEPVAALAALGQLAGEAHRVVYLVGGQIKAVGDGLRAASRRRGCARRAASRHARAVWACCVCALLRGLQLMQRDTLGDAAVWRARSSAVLS